jgi:cytochrome b561
MNTDTAGSLEMPRTGRAGYTRLAILLHWAVGFLIFANIAGGFFMASFPKTDPIHDRTLFFHASVGALVFMLAVVRLGWRLSHRPSPLPPSLPAWQQMAAHSLHWLLYLLMFVIPLIGYLHRLAGAHPVSFFGIGDLPILIGRNEPFRVWTHSAHETLAWLLCGLLVLHLAAALKHRFIDRDGVAERMMRLPFNRAD